MKIIIFNKDLRSEMQMYLALSNHYDVEIAQDLEDLMNMLEQEATDLTFLGLDAEEGNPLEVDALDLIQKVLHKQPKVKVVGICNQVNEDTKKEAADCGVQVITRPIKNRDLLQAVAH